jgi:hypothetical protein
MENSTSLYLFTTEEIEQIEAAECLPSFGAGSSVFQFAIQKYKDLGIQNCNFACCFVWV